MVAINILTVVRYENSLPNNIRTTDAPLVSTSQRQLDKMDQLAIRHHQNRSDILVLLAPLLGLTRSII